MVFFLMGDAYLLFKHTTKGISVHQVISLDFIFLFPFVSVFRILKINLT
jgi:hypothetical protein